MEPNKLEKQFREQLNSREIKPSEMAWTKLDTMLSATEKPKTKFPWLYVAASFIGLLLIGTAYFSQSNKNRTFEGKEVVIDNNKKGVIKKERILTTKKKSTLKDGGVISKVKKENYRATNSIIKNQVVQNSKSDSLNLIIEKGRINQKLGESTSLALNDKSVDEMLAIVKITSKSAVKVNPSTLLSQVDGELELSFREKVINKINKNYQTVKVVLSNRNQE
ncbi:hypothetical protein [Flavobacterium magnesitis]|uniref:hypothetical protein n=1 Tax=Flavobacterium magnesitis TaxID=3138077 RepID=UPI00358F6746